MEVRTILWMEMDISGILKNVLWLINMIIQAHLLKQVNVAMVMPK